MTIEQPNVPLGGTPPPFFRAGDPEQRPSRGSMLHSADIPSGARGQLPDVEETAVADKRRAIGKRSARRCRIPSEDTARRAHELAEEETK